MAVKLIPTRNISDQFYKLDKDTVERKEDVPGSKSGNNGFVKKFTRYSKNVLKSTKNAAFGVVDAYVPNIKGVRDELKNVAISAKNDAVKLVGPLKSSARSISGDDGAVASFKRKVTVQLENIKKDVKNRIQTGNLYKTDDMIMQEQMASEFGGDFGSFGFGADDFSSFASDSDSFRTEQAPDVLSDEPFGGVSKGVTRKVNISAQQRAKRAVHTPSTPKVKMNQPSSNGGVTKGDLTVAETTGSGIQAVISQQENLWARNVAAAEIHNKKVITYLDNILKGVNAQVDYQNNVSSTGTSAQLEFQGKLLAANEDMLNHMRELKDIVVAVNGQKKDIVENTKNSYKITSNNDQREVIDGSVGFNGNEYWKQIKENFQDTGVGSMLGMLPMFSMLGEGAGNVNVVQEGLKAFLKSRVSNATRGKLFTLNETLGNFGSLLIGRANQAARFGKTPLEQTLGKLFGQRSTHVELNNFGTKNIDSQVAWTGRSDKTLNEVIPSLLAKIHASMTGGDELVWDHAKGDWTSKGVLHEERKQKIEMAYSDARVSSINREMGKRSKMQGFETYADTISKNLMKSGQQFNLALATGNDEKSKEYRRIVLGELADDPKATKALGEFSRLFMKMSSAEQANYNSGVLKAGINAQKNINEINSYYMKNGGVAALATASKTDRIRELKRSIQFDTKYKLGFGAKKDTNEWLKKKNDKIKALEELIKLQRTNGSDKVEILKDINDDNSEWETVDYKEAMDRLKSEKIVAQEDKRRIARLGDVTQATFWNAISARSDIVKQNSKLNKGVDKFADFAFKGIDILSGNSVHGSGLLESGNEYAEEVKKNTETWRNYFETTKAKLEQSTRFNKNTKLGQAALWLLNTADQNLSVDAAKAATEGVVIDANGKPSKIDALFNTAKETFEKTFEAAMGTPIAKAVTEKANDILNSEQVKNIKSKAKPVTDKVKSTTEKVEKVLKSEKVKDFTTKANAAIFEDSIDKNIADATKAATEAKAKTKKSIKNLIDTVSDKAELGVEKATDIAIDALGKFVDGAEKLDKSLKQHKKEVRRLAEELLRHWQFGENCTTDELVETYYSNDYIDKATLRQACEAADKTIRMRIYNTVSKSEGAVSGAIKTGLAMFAGLSFSKAFNAAQAKVAKGIALVEIKAIKIAVKHKINKAVKHAPKPIKKAGEKAVETAGNIVDSVGEFYENNKTREGFDFSSLRPSWLGGRKKDKADKVKLIGDNPWYSPDDPKDNDMAAVKFMKWFYSPGMMGLSPRALGQGAGKLVEGIGNNVPGMIEKGLGGLGKGALSGLKLGAKGLGKTLGTGLGVAGAALPMAALWTLSTIPNALELAKGAGKGIMKGIPNLLTNTLSMPMRMIPKAGKYLKSYVKGTEKYQNLVAAAMERGFVDVSDMKKKDLYAYITNIQGAAGKALRDMDEYKNLEKEIAKADNTRNLARKMFRQIKKSARDVKLHIKMQSNGTYRYRNILRVLDLAKKDAGFDVYDLDKPGLYAYVKGLEASSNKKHTDLYKTITNMTEWKRIEKDGGIKGYFAEVKDDIVDNFKKKVIDPWKRFKSWLRLGKYRKLTVPLAVAGVEGAEFIDSKEELWSHLTAMAESKQRKQKTLFDAISRQGIYQKLRVEMTAKNLEGKDKEDFLNKEKKKEKIRKKYGSLISIVRLHLTNKNIEFNEDDLSDPEALFAFINALPDKERNSIANMKQYKKLYKEHNKGKGEGEQEGMEYNSFFKTLLGKGTNLFKPGENPNGMKNTPWSWIRGKFKGMSPDESAEEEYYAPDGKPVGKFRKYLMKKGIGATAADKARALAEDLGGSEDGLTYNGPKRTRLQKIMPAAVGGGLATLAAAKGGALLGTAAIPIIGAPIGAALGVAGAYGINHLMNYVQRRELAKNFKNKNNVIPGAGNAVSGGITQDVANVSNINGDNSSTSSTDKPGILSKTKGVLNTGLGKIGKAAGAVGGFIGKLFGPKESAESAASDKAFNITVSGASKAKENMNGSMEKKARMALKINPLATITGLVAGITKQLGKLNEGIGIDGKGNLNPKNKDSLAASMKNLENKAGGGALGGLLSKVVPLLSAIGVALGAGALIKNIVNIGDRFKKEGTAEGIAYSVGLQNESDTKFNADGSEKGTISQLVDRGADRLKGAFIKGIGRSKGGKNAMVQLAKKGIKKATDLGLVGVLKRGIKNFLGNKIVKNMLGTAAGKIKGFLDPLMERIGKTAAGKAAKSGAGKIAKAIPAIGQALTIADAIKDFIAGAVQAPRYFKISSSECTAGMRLCASLTAGLRTLIEGLLSGSGVGIGISFAMALIPEDWLVQSMYKLIASDDAKAELEQKQNEFKQRAESMGVSVERLNEAENTTFGQKITMGIKAAFSDKTYEDLKNEKADKLLKADANYKGSHDSSSYMNDISVIADPNKPGMEKLDDKVARWLTPSSDGNWLPVSNIVDSAKGAGYCWPHDAAKWHYVCTSPFGERTQPTTGNKGVFHCGVDMRCRHDALYAFCSGTVVFAGFTSDDFGGTVVIQGDNGVIAVTAHHRDIKVKTGEQVKAGQPIGTSGGDPNDPGDKKGIGVNSKGGPASTGLHLHFSVVVGKTVVDPIGFVLNGCRFTDDIKSHELYGVLKRLLTNTCKIDFSGKQEEIMNGDLTTDVAPEASLTDAAKEAGMSKSEVAKLGSQTSSGHDYTTKVNDNKTSTSNNSSNGSTASTAVKATAKDTPVSMANDTNSLLARALDIQNNIYKEQVRHNAIVESFIKLMTSNNNPSKAQMVRRDLKEKIDNISPSLVAGADRNAVGL